MGPYCLIPLDGEVPLATKVKCIILAIQSFQLPHVLFYVRQAAGYSCLVMVLSFGAS